MVQQYLDHCREILTSPYTDFKKGSKGPREARGNGLISLMGHENHYDLREGLPIVTTKDTYWKGIVHELLWFISGDTNIKYLEDNKVDIWRKDTFHHNLPAMVRAGHFSEGDGEKYTQRWRDALEKFGSLVKTDEEFASHFGDAGAVYGKQWRKWDYVDENGNPQVMDQLGGLVERLKKRPMSKRTIVTAWNPGEVSRASLPPCHILFQTATNEDGEMDLRLDQRSCDQFLGVPFNITSYAILTHIIAQEAGLTPRRFVHEFGDAHFYAGFAKRSPWYRENLQELKKKVAAIPKDDRERYLEVRDWVDANVPRDEMEERYDQIPVVLEQMAREPYKPPKLTIESKPLDELTFEDFKIEGFEHHPHISREMVV